MGDYAAFLDHLLQPINSCVKAWRRLFKAPRERKWTGRTKGTRTRPVLETARRAVTGSAAEEGTATRTANASRRETPNRDLVSGPAFGLETWGASQIQVCVEELMELRNSCVLLPSFQSLATSAHKHDHTKIRSKFYQGLHPPLQAGIAVLDHTCLQLLC